MKKNFISKLTIAMVAVFSLASCGEEVIIDNPNGKGTMFSAATIDFDGADGTRTRIDRNRVYYWQYNDQIWVNDGGTWVKSSDSELSANQRSANFYYDKLMTADSYEVVYTGYNSPSATQVTIPATITTTQNIGTDIGERGDCGVATATRQADGTYKFELLHKSSYLGIAPLKAGYINRNYKWTKIEVTDVNGKPIAGTFGFSHAGGIDSTNVTSPSASITLNVGDIQLANTYLQNYNTDYSYIYVVLPPLYRKLNVKYYFVNMDNPSEEITMSVPLNARQFIENNVVQFRHGLKPDFYQWDAPRTEPYDLTRVGAQSNFNYNKANPLTQASGSCATMPNPNEMAWYLKNGDPRWDNTTEWTIDGGATYHTGGVWIKKKANIAGFSSTVDPDGVDRRSTYQSTTITTSNYKSDGKPANTSQYFFLPAQGYQGTAGHGNIGTQGSYWLSYSADPNAYGYATGYCVVFNQNSITMGRGERTFGFVAGNGSDWFK